MKRLWHPRFLIVAAFIGMIVLLACEDNVSESLQNNLKVSGDFLTGQVYFWDAYLIADKVARDTPFGDAITLLF